MTYSPEEESKVNRFGDSNVVHHDSISKYMMRISNHQ